MVADLKDLARLSVELVSKHGAKLVESRAEKGEALTIIISEEGIKRVDYSENKGLSIRFLMNDMWHFSSLDNPSKRKIHNQVKNMIKAARSSRGNEIIEIAETKTVRDRVRVKGKRDIQNTPVDEICSIPLSLHRRLQSEDKAPKTLKSYTISLAASYGEDFFVSSDGSEIAMEAPFTVMTFSAVLQEDGKLAKSADAIGGTYGLEFYKDGSIWKPFELADSVLSRGRVALKGKRPPKGYYPVVLDQSMTGTLIHEAFGHLCEADLVMAGGVLNRGMIKEQIADKGVTIIDEGIRKDGAWVPYDDEGVRHEKTTLVEDGALKTFMVNREYAAKLGIDPTGNARTSNYHTPPIIRMRNTYLRKGDFSFEELIEDIRQGLYVQKFMGGQASLIGMFQFAGQVGWLIEKGQLSMPVRDVTISGSTLETLKTLDAIGKDFGTDIGICGKGQQISVGSGGPPIRVPKLNVGGD
ncbi:MAG: TldD/PmbA family protein [Candidatus Hodarchaeota archaeon]